jgi:hypothetical protein
MQCRPRLQPQQPLSIQWPFAAWNRTGSSSPAIQSKAFRTSLLLVRFSCFYRPTSLLSNRAQLAFHPTQREPAQETIDPEGGGSGGPVMGLEHSGPGDRGGGVWGRGGGGSWLKFCCYSSFLTWACSALILRFAFASFPLSSSAVGSQSPSLSLSLPHAAFVSSSRGTSDKFNCFYRQSFPANEKPRALFLKFGATRGNV